MKTILNKKEGLKKEKYVYVNFEGNGMQYIYKTDLNLKVGNIVEAPTLNYVFKQNAIVKQVIALADRELPIDKSKILTITKIISQKDEDGIFDKLGFITKHIDKSLVKEWRFDYENDWVKCWKSNFGFTISYEQDGVLEVFYFNKQTEDVFNEYTITDHKDFETKLAFVETITSKLYHNKITKEEFDKLFNKLP